MRVRVRALARLWVLLVDCIEKIVCRGCSGEQRERSDFCPAIYVMACGPTVRAVRVHNQQTLPYVHIIIRVVGFVLSAMISSYGMFCHGCLLQQVEEFGRSLVVSQALALHCKRRGHARWQLCSVAVQFVCVCGCICVCSVSPFVSARQRRIERCEIW